MSPMCERHLSKSKRHTHTFRDDYATSRTRTGSRSCRTKELRAHKKPPTQISQRCLQVRRLKRQNARGTYLLDSRETSDPKPKIEQTVSRRLINKITKYCRNQIRHSQPAYLHVDAKYEGTPLVRFHSLSEQKRRGAVIFDDYFK